METLESPIILIETAIAQLHEVAPPGSCEVLDGSALLLIKAASELREIDKA